MNKASSLSLSSNAVLVWNTLRISEIVNQRAVKRKKRVRLHKIRLPFSLPLPDLPGVAGDFLCDFMCQPEGFFHQIGGGRESVRLCNRLLQFLGVFPIHGVR